jgi:hypothetical protein
VGYTIDMHESEFSEATGVLSDAAPDDWVELIRVFANLNPQIMMADDQPEHCRHHQSCPHVRRAKVGW